MDCRDPEYQDVHVLVRVFIMKLIVLCLRPPWQLVSGSPCRNDDLPTTIHLEPNLCHSFIKYPTSHKQALTI